MVTPGDAYGPSSEAYGTGMLTPVATLDNTFYVQASKFGPCYDVLPEIRLNTGAYLWYFNVVHGMRKSVASAERHKLRLLYETLSRVSRVFF